MIIKYNSSERNYHINFEKVCHFRPKFDYEIEFYFDGEDRVMLAFHSKEERDKALVKIEECYTYGILICDLG